MARISGNIKIHELKGPRLPYTPLEAEVRENEYVYLDADSIAVDDGEGILYWIDSIITADGGSVRVYDNNAASGNTLSAAYAAKAPHNVPQSWDPPKNYRHGIFADVTNALVEICYKPIARNLRSTVTVAYAPGTSDVVSRLTVRVVGSTKDLVARLVTRKETERALVSMVTVVAVTWNQTKDLVSTLAVRRQGANDLGSRVDVAFISGTSDLVSRLTVRAQGTRALVCKLYADQTP